LSDDLLNEIKELCKEKFKDYDGRITVKEREVFIYLNLYHGRDIKKIYDEKWILIWGKT